MANPKRVSHGISQRYHIAEQNQFEARFTDISHSPFIRAPALTALRAINQSLYNDHEITSDVLEGFLDSADADQQVEFRLALLTWHFDARPKSEVSKEMVDFVGSCISAKGDDPKIENASLAKTLKSIWSASSFYQGKNKETLETFQLRVIEILVGEAFMGHHIN